MANAVRVFLLFKINKMAFINSGSRYRIYKRDNHRCLKCGCPHSLTIDHVIPLSKGGKNHVDNYQTLCRKCNSKKGNTIGGDYRLRAFIGEYTYTETELELIERIKKREEAEANTRALARIGLEEQARRHPDRYLDCGGGVVIEKNLINFHIAS